MLLSLEEAELDSGLRAASSGSGSGAAASIVAAEELAGCRAKSSSSTFSIAGV